MKTGFNLKVLTGRQLYVMFADSSSEVIDIYIHINRHLQLN